MLKVFISFLMLSHCFELLYAMEESLDSQKKVVIIGGGMAGLTAAYQLQKKGISSVIYEARNRLGGRTNTRYLSQDTYFEEGGTFIDKEHEQARLLAGELSVKLTPIEVNSTKKIDFWFEGKYQPINEAMHNQLQKLANILEELKGQVEDFQWNFSLKDNLKKHQLTDFQKKFLETFYISDVGIEFEKASNNDIDYLQKLIEDYSNLIETFILKGLGSYTPRFLVEGGMSKLVGALVENIKSTTSFHLNHILTEIKCDNNNHYILTFREGENTKTIQAEKVLITIPFSVLRYVSIDKSVKLSDLSHEVIKLLPYATHSKVGIQISNKENLNNLLYHLNIDDKFMAWPGENMLTIYLGGEQGKGLTQEKIATFLNHHKKELTQSYPYITKIDKPIVINWTQDPYSLGSYSVHSMDFSKKIKTGIASAEYQVSESKMDPLCDYAEPTIDEKLFFAGEHTICGESRAHIEGAIQSGIIAAENIFRSYHPTNKQKTINKLNELLSNAVDTGDIELITSLLRMGAQINGSNYWQTPLERAIERGDYKIIKLLIDKGADVKNVFNVEEKIVGMGLKSKLDMDSIQGLIKTFNKDYDENKTFIFAAGYPQGLLYIQKFINNSRNVDPTLLISALIKSAKNPDCFNIYKFLLGKLEPQEIDRIKPGTLRELLTSAIINPNGSALVKLLLDKGFTINKRIATYLLTYMIDLGDDLDNKLGSFALLLSLGADPNVLMSNSAGFSYEMVPILELVAEKNLKEVVELLLENGARWEHVKVNGKTLLTYSQEKNWNDVIKFIEQDTQRKS